ncbi:hypothetical protein DYB32_004248 [Aphanomyces invadans]|uniref:THIF-type NAD/FAD binding fold domain-containing protein n=1 Tax=Aphanomyces invadans TaxID=157072 RepID=A0A3R6ZRA4_9STRA|nr:hypothetical protein DYB32_004248 [Aphanomyces invadans]
MKTPSGMSVVEVAAVFTLGVVTAAVGQYLLAQQQPRRAAKPLATPSAPQPVAATSADAALSTEQFSRICSFFGEEGFEKIQNAFVIVIGLGGVGSHAAHMLARSGVRHLRLIDFDNVTLSSLNRHAVATRADVGLSKAQVLKQRLLEIVPQANIEAVPVMFEDAVADELLAGTIRFVMGLAVPFSQVALLTAASAKSLKVITATSAGAKADPTRIHIGTLHDSVRDNLATKIRYFLKKKGVDASTITTVYSSEKSRCKLLPLDSDQVDNPNQFGNVENFRIRVIPVLAARKGRRLRVRTCELSVHSVCLSTVSKIAVDKDDMDFIYQEVWKARSSVSGIRCGGFDRMFMSRWRYELPLSPGNIVILTTKEMALMDDKGIEAFGADVVARIDARLQSFGTWDVSA